MRCGGLRLMNISERSFEKCGYVWTILVWMVMYGGEG